MSGSPTAEFSDAPTPTIVVSPEWERVEQRIPDGSCHYSPPVPVTARSRKLGLSLPSGEFHGLTPRQAQECLADYRSTHPDGATADFPCVLTYQGQVASHCFLGAIKTPNHIWNALQLLRNEGSATFTLVELSEVAAPSGPDTALAWLHRMGCGAVCRSRRWRIEFTPDLYPKHPWPTAQVFLFYTGKSSIRRSKPYGYCQTLRGEGSLRDQFLALALFSLETGYYLPDTISITGPNVWRTQLHAWDLGLSGYRVWHHPKPLFRPRTYILQRVDGPGQYETLATTAAVL